MTRIIKFLLVEDDDAHAKIIIRTFQKERTGNTIDRVSDGTEALRYLRREDEFLQEAIPDIVLLDLKLPKRDGLDILKEIRSDKKLNSLPVVILTTSEADRDKARAYDLHANSYLVKPADADSFRQMVKDLNFYWGVWNQPALANRYSHEKGEKI